MADTDIRAAEANDNTLDWHALLAEYQAVEALPPNDWNDDNIDLAGDLAEQLLSTPAPDAQALCWKLDYFLAQKNGSESYTSEFVAQTVADYRRMLKSDGVPANLAEQDFAGVSLRFEMSNEDWALAHLPWIRLATVLLRDNAEEMTARFRDKFVATGEIPDMLEGIANTKEHLQGLVNVLDSALMRSFIALERLGYSPDCPPPAGTVQ